jgi:hypothetical protein
MTNQNIQLQFLYLGVSLLSSFCIITNFNIITCSNIVGFTCLIDFYFVKKNDMRLHHMLVLCMIDYMNKHVDIKNRNDIVYVILSTEISTVFLIMNNLLDKMVIFKNINKLFFVFTFVYYRIYNYSYYLILDKNIYNNFVIYSKNNFEFYKIYIGVYGMFILNLYWFTLILHGIITLYLD